MAERLGRFLAGCGDLPGYLIADSAERLAHAFAIVGESLAFACELADQVPDTVLIFCVGPLKRGDFIVNQRFQFPGASERA